MKINYNISEIYVRRKSYIYLCITKTRKQKLKTELRNIKASEIFIQNIY